MEENKLEINSLAPKFSAKALHENQIKTVNLDDYKGKWVILMFYPGDFTFICPTELQDVSSKYEALKEMGVEVLSVSTDSVFVHKAWKDTSAAIKSIEFPMVADPNAQISNSYGVYIAEEGICLRGTFIIDPDQTLKCVEMHDNSIGRSGDELVRKIKAAQFVRMNGGEVCPANWKPGDKTLKPGLDLVGKI